MKKWIWDILAGTGLALFCVGVGLIYHPLPFIVCGAAFLAVGILGARPK